VASRLVCSNTGGFFGGVLGVKMGTHKQETNKYRIDRYNYYDSADAKESTEEMEANYFACCLLVPEQKLRNILEETNDIAAISKYFGVDPSVVNLRINFLKMKKII
jgi:Zn-dependent peptidase ImmA (M78 family)